MVEEKSLIFLILRLILGLVFLYHGFNKIIKLSSWTESMEKKGIHSIISVLAAIFEFILGLCLCFGFFTKYAAVGAALFMVAAIYLSHIKDPIKKYVYQITLLLIAVLICIDGPGIYSIDKVKPT